MQGLAGLILWSGCATNMNGDHQSVTIFTTPPEAKVTVDERVHLTSPGTVSLSRKADHIVDIEKDGYQLATLRIGRTWSWWVLGDAWCLFFIPKCYNTDVESGGYYVFDNEFRVTLTPRSQPEPAASPRKPLR
jgi:hypothetical protein